MLKLLGGPIKKGECRLLWDLGSYSAVAVAGLGNSCEDWDKLEGMNGDKENVRIAAAAGSNGLLSQKISKIDIEDFNDAENSAIGSVLGTYKYQAQKTQDKQVPKTELCFVGDSSQKPRWNEGIILAEAQNFTRELMEMPANLMTPTIFANTVGKEMDKLGVEWHAHDKCWAQNLGMNSFLSVGKGSCEPPVFLELMYQGNKEDKSSACLIGKGVTFDSGGISIKPAMSMDLMRADMGGAACVVGTIKALAALKKKVNVRGLIPLCENMPSSTANKPGDVVYAMNGKSICIDNTDAEGRLILADALCYSGKFENKFVLDIATLTGAISVALGDCLAGVYTNNDELWHKINKAGSETGDRVWRMPLLKHYTEQVTKNSGHDVNNVGKLKGGGSCTAAAFLREFVPKDTKWVHVDMASVMGNCTDQSYTGSKGMGGRPMRTLVDFVLNASSS